LIHSKIDESISEGDVNMLHQDTENTTEVGSSVEQLTSQVNEHLLTSLTDLHKALQLTLKDHAILPLYNWLYAATLPYIQSAACAIDEDQHILNYITDVIVDLGSKWSLREYKGIKSRKRNLIDQLVELYKAIMQVAVRAGRNSILTQDDVSTKAIVSISNQIEEFQARIEASEDTITDDQQRIKNAIAQFIPVKALENHPDLSDYKRKLSTQLDSLTKTFQSNQFEVEDQKETPAQLINKIEAEIARVQALSLVEIDIEPNLLANSPAKKNIDHQFQLLHKNELAHSTLLTLSEADEEKKAEALQLPTIIKKAKSIKADLVRQKEMIDTLSERKNNHNDDLEKNFIAFEKVTKEQGYFGSWQSEEKYGVKGAIVSLRLTLLFIESITIGQMDVLDAREKELQGRISYINSKLREFTESQRDAKVSQDETTKLLAEFDARQKQVARAVPSMFAKQKQAEKRLFEEQLTRAKSVYFLQLEMRRKQCIQKINEINHYNFKLPSHKPLAIFAGLSGLGTVSTTGIAVAAFAFKIAALAFVASNPVGWLVGLAVGTAALVATGSVLGTKGYNRYKKNKLLNHYEAYEQEALFKQNQTLKKRQIPDTTRHLMMRHGIKIKPDSLASVEGDVACYVVGKEYEQAQLFLNVGRKQLFFKAGSRAVSIAKDKAEFSTQIKRYSAAPAA
jgi:hypothetical protein